MFNIYDDIYGLEHKRIIDLDPRSIDLDPPTSDFDRLPPEFTQLLKPFLMPPFEPNSTKNFLAMLLSNDPTQILSRREGPLFNTWDIQGDLRSDISQNIIYNQPLTSYNPNNQPPIFDPDKIYKATLVLRFGYTVYENDLHGGNPVIRNGWLAYDYPKKDTFTAMRQVYSALLNPNTDSINGFIHDATGGTGNLNFLLDLFNYWAKHYLYTQNEGASRLGSRNEYRIKPYEYIMATYPLSMDITKRKEFIIFGLHHGNLGIFFQPVIQANGPETLNRYIGVGKQKRSKRRSKRSRRKVRRGHIISSRRKSRSL
tara:strand:+ start:657 stop:1595 length:939 start_codon:yes stop_codon:yes gene_type:complete